MNPRLRKARKVVLMFLALYVLTIAVATYCGISNVPETAKRGSLGTSFVTMIAFIVSYIRFMVIDHQETVGKIKAKCKTLVEG